MTSYRIPKSLDSIDSYLRRKKIDPSVYGLTNIKSHLDKFYFLIDYLYCYRFTKIDKDGEGHAFQYVPLNSRKLKKVMGDKYYKPIINILIDAEVIDYSDQYSTYHHFSKGARLKPAFMLNYATDTRIKFFKKNGSVTKNIDRLSLMKVKTYPPALIDWLNTQFRKISIDEHQAKFYINYRLNKYNTHPTDAISQVANPPSFYSQEQYDFDWYAIESMTHKYISVISNEITHRLYCQFSNMSKRLRLFIKFNNDLAHCVDIKNSQPLLLALYLKNDPGVNYSAEVDNLLQVCLEGRFYSSIMNGTGIEDKAHVKDQVYTYILFGRSYGENTKSKVLSYFRTTYPTIHAYLNDYLKTDGLFNSDDPVIQDIMRLKGYSKRDSYKIMSVYLQRIEAEIMIQGVMKKCFELNIPSFPLHDAIFTTSEKLHLVKSIIINEFKERYNIKPPLNTY